jgi:hypothetical protein
VLYAAAYRVSQVWHARGGGKAALTPAQKTQAKALVAEGTAILGNGHNPKKKDDWDKWWRKNLSKSSRKLYDRLKGPHPRRAN